MRKLFILSLFLWAPLAWSVDETPPEIPAEDPPESIMLEQPQDEQAIDLPPPVESGEPMDPEITIIKRGDRTIHEYRVNGELYMVKIVPSVGPAYYMIDTNGDGNLNVRRSDLEKGVQVPQWVLFSWD